MNWKDEIRSALKSPKEISSFFNLAPLTELKDYPSFIPLKFAEHIRRSSSESLFRQFLPSTEETSFKGGYVDPIGDSKNSVDGGIIHRYDNRILFSPTTKCPINCRYCFRKNELHHENDIFKSSLTKLKEYLVQDQAINEVILTGGDPFFISNRKISELFDLLEDIPSVKYIRFHSRFPIIIPSRFDEELLKILTASSKKVIIAIHCNHTDEFTSENIQVIKRIASHKIELLSQTVLLKTVNDKVEDLLALFTRFDDFGIRPYYLHHPDQVKGAMHFYLTLEEGRLLYSQLRKSLSGWLIPHYVIDNYLGQGKQFAFNPESLKFSGQMLDIRNKPVSYLS